MILIRNCFTVTIHIYLFRIFNNRLSDFFFVAARYAAMFEKQIENYYEQRRDDRESNLVKRELSKE